MPSDETGLLDTVLRGAFGLELVVGLLACSAVLGYLAYETLARRAGELLAAAGGGAVGVGAAVVLLGLAWRLER
jgi:ABC-type Co2+ transport system permease subunit